MLFNSLQFLLFFPLVTAGYFFLPHRVRWAWLLGASCLFYMAFVPAYILILGFTIVIDYVAGILIEGATARWRKTYLVLSLVSNIGFLAFFKYANFFIENTNVVAGWTGGHPLPIMGIVLPIGLSFHTFQAMAYTIEVYRGNQKAERHFGIYALYVLFYPQLVAGPIERPQNILHQLKERHQFDPAAASRGLQLMAWGFFQKVVVADRLAKLANPIFDHVQENHGLLLALAAVAFTFQIYFDFAGYSDIAIGAAEVMGIRLMTNFRQPFFSSSISEFWSRWHISLSTWFRDYLYIPLGGNRVSVPRWYANLAIVFLVSGFWHGARWNFIVWGGLHGMYLIVALILAPHLPRALRDTSRFWVRGWNVGSTFCLVCLAFVFFRAVRFDDAVFLIRHIPTGFSEDLARLVVRHDVVGLMHGKGLPAPKEWAVMLVGLLATLVVQQLQQKGSVRARLALAPPWIRWPAYSALAYSCVLFGNSGGAQFIYFQF